MFCRLLAVASLLSTVTIVTANASTQTLSPQEVYKKRVSSVVFFRSKAKGEDMSYGVVISKEGHVLTAKHVVDAFGAEAVRGTLGAKGKGALFEFDRVAEIPNRDVVLLKIKEFPSNLEPAPVGKADHFKEAETRIEILTGLVDQKNSIPLTATISNRFEARPDIWNAQGIGIDPGKSGSPAFDEFGNVVGFVPTGYKGEGIFQLQTFDSLLDWLKQYGVPVEDRIRPDKFMVFVRGERQEHERAGLREKLTRIAERWLGIKAADVEEEPAFMADLMARWEHPSQKLLEDVVNAEGARQWIADRDAQRLYVYVVKWPFFPSDTNPLPVRHFLVTLDYDGTKITPKLSSLNGTILQPMPGPGADGDQIERVQRGNALALAKSAAATLDTRFRKNDFVLAQCLKTAPDAVLPTEVVEKYNEWKYSAAQILKDELDKQWHDDPAYHSYRVESMLPGSCSGNFVEDVEMDWEEKLKAAMAELIIGSAVKGYERPSDALSVLWSLRKPRSIDERPPRKVLVHLNGDDFAAGLARNIVANWKVMIEKLRD